VTGSVADNRRSARKFYAVMAAAMTLGLALDYAGFNAVKMLFWSVIVNALLAPPLILLVIHSTSGTKVMGKRVNPPVLKYLGWAFCSLGCAAVESRTFGNSGNSSAAGSGRAGSAGTTRLVMASNSHAPNIGGASMSSGSSGFSSSSARVAWARCIERRTRSSGATWRLRDCRRTNTIEPLQHAPLTDRIAEVRNMTVTR
jgi:hypothetical protein